MMFSIEEVKAVAHDLAIAEIKETGLGSSEYMVERYVKTYTGIIEAFKKLRLSTDQ
jgi:hypothetical protein